MKKELTDIEIERICIRKGYVDWERCVATGKVTAYNPKTKKFVQVRR